jgi:hypothetical protein
MRSNNSSFSCAPPKNHPRRTAFHSPGLSFLSERIVSQTGAIQLAKYELLDGFRTQPREHDRVSDAGTDFLVDAQGEGLEEWGLANEDEIVRARKILAQQPEFAQAVGGHEMSIVDDGEERVD